MQAGYTVITFYPNKSTVNIYFVDHVSFIVFVCCQHWKLCALKCKQVFKRLAAFLHVRVLSNLCLEGELTHKSCLTLSGVLGSDWNLLWFIRCAATEYLHKNNWLWYKDTVRYEGNYIKYSATDGRDNYSLKYTAQCAVQRYKGSSITGKAVHLWFPSISNQAWFWQLFCSVRRARKPVGSNTILILIKKGKSRLYRITTSLVN